MFKVIVPATTANIGPGFDCLGMALNLYNTIEISDDTDKLIIEPGHFGSRIENNENNLIYRSIKRLYDEASLELPPIKIVENCNIPICRGMGSSAACIIGGLVAANEMLGNKFKNEKILELGCEMEGHPDNATPALLGGFVISAVVDGQVKYIHNPVNSKIKFMAMIPDFELATKKARGVLPTHIDYKDAVFNVGRSSMLTASLITGNMENIHYAVQDKLHQPYRIGLINDGELIFKAAEDLGVDAIFISGSGSTLMAIISDDMIIDKMKIFCRSLNTNWDIRLLEADNLGAQVIKS